MSLFQKSFEGKIKWVHSFHYWYFLVYTALFECQEKGINIDPFNLKEENKLSVVELAKQIWTDKNPKAYEEFLTQIVSQYGLQFCPTYSVIGSIVSQEIIKVVESKSIQTQIKTNLLSTGWCTTVKKAMLLLSKIQHKRLFFKLKMGIVKLDKNI